jgi:tRNA(Arg) A34 adenosine deaminase TadA
MAAIIDTISNQDMNFLTLARNEADFSPCLQRHGCVAVLNGTVIGRGCNHYRNSSSDGFIKNTCTCHAEIAALREVYKKFNIYYNYSVNQKKGEKYQKVV